MFLMKFCDFCPICIIDLLANGNCLKQNSRKDLLHLFVLGDVNGGLLVGVEGTRVSPLLKQGPHDILLVVLEIVKITGSIIIW
jgi:hypothetical protein